MCNFTKSLIFTAIYEFKNYIPKNYHYFFRFREFFMKFLLLIFLITASTFSQNKSCHRINPYPGVDSLRLEKLEEIKKDEQKQKMILKIEMERLELDLQKLLISGFDLAKIKEIINKKSVIWSKIQYSKYEADAKRKKILTEKEWNKYRFITINVEKRKREKLKNSCKNPKHNS